MNRILLLAIGLSVLAMVGFLALAPGRHTTPVATMDPVVPTTIPEQPPAPLPDLAQSAEDTRAAEAVFREWTAHLAELGLRLEAEQIVAGDNGGAAIRGITLSPIGAAAPFAWTWHADQGTMTAEMGDVFLVIGGEQRLEATLGPQTRFFTVAAGTMEISAPQSHEAGRGILQVTVADLRLEDAQGAPVGEMARARIEYRMPSSQAGEESEMGLSVQNLMLTAWARLPFGNTLGSLDASIGITPDGQLELNDLDVHWQTLRLAGSGRLDLQPDAPPSGVFDIEAENFLGALDAVKAVQGAAQPELSRIQAALLRESVENQGAKLPFRMVIRDGAVLLEGAPRGLPDLDLGVNFF